MRSFYPCLVDRERGLVGRNPGPQHRLKIRSLTSAPRDPVLGPRLVELPSTRTSGSRTGQFPVTPFICRYRKEGLCGSRTGRFRRQLRCEHNDNRDENFQARRWLPICVRTITYTRFRLAASLSCRSRASWAAFQFPSFHHIWPDPGDVRNGWHIADRRPRRWPEVVDGNRTSRERGRLYRPLAGRLRPEWPPGPLNRCLHAAVR